MPEGSNVIGQKAELNQSLQNKKILFTKHGTTYMSKNKHSLQETCVEGGYYVLTVTYELERKQVAY